MRQALLAALFLSAFGCSQDDTSILLLLDGDMAPGADMDGLGLAMARDGAQIWSTHHDLGPDAALPVSYVLKPTSAEDSIVEVEVTASLAGRRQLQASRIAAFSRGQQVTVNICLWRRCVDSDLPACREGSCDLAPGGDGDADADAGMDADADHADVAHPDADGDDASAPDGRVDADAPPPDAETSSDADRSTDADAPGDADGLADADGESEPIDWICADGCTEAGNGDCEDGGEGSISRACSYGYDCTDCGPRDVADCPPTCESTGAECGDDGCGGSCGECAEGSTCTVGGFCVRWIEVRPDGPFYVGSPGTEAGRGSDERRHEVTLSHAFVLAEREAHQAWMRAAFEGADLSVFINCGDDCPAEAWLWSHYAVFTNVLSYFEGYQPCYECDEYLLSCQLQPWLESPYECEGYRLPTEAEWEYAARAGTTTASYNGDLPAGLLECQADNPVLSTIAWYCANSSVSYVGAWDCSSLGPWPTCGTQPGALLEPNAWGFYDMLGNVSEVVHDLYAPYTSEAQVDPFGPLTGDAHVVKSCGFASHASRCRAAERFGLAFDLRGIDVGVRPARTIFDE